MAVTKPPVDTAYRSPNCGGYGTPRDIEAWCVHITDGSNSLGWLMNPASQASANYLVRQDGYIYELVPPDTSPWTNGDVQQPDMANPLIASWVHARVNPNTKTLTVEMEGFTTAWQPGALTDAQEYSLVWLLAWGCDAYHLTPDATHIIRHQQLNNVTRHNCPGFSTEEWSKYIAATATLVAGEDEVKIPARGTAVSYLAEDGQPITVIAWDGQATAIDGTAFVDVGLTCTNADGRRYSRSLKDGVMGPWREITPGG